MLTEKKCRYRLARSRTSPFHGGNAGSNPAGGTTKKNEPPLLIRGEVRRGRTSAIPSRPITPLISSPRSVIPRRHICHFEAKPRNPFFIYSPFTKSTQTRSFAALRMTTRRHSAILAFLHFHIHIPHSLIHIIPSLPPHSAPSGYPCFLRHAAIFL